jgi:cell division protein FtsQ
MGFPPVLRKEFHFSAPYSGLWRFSRPCSGVAQRSSKIDSLPWEDQTSEESRFRRVQQVSPRTGRALPGMPVDMADPDEDEELPRPRRRYDTTPSGPWYRPAGKLGRVLLASGALLVIGGLTTGVILVRNLLERDSRFRIAGTENIQAVGLSQVARADILPVFGEDIGKNIFFIHLNERRKELEQIPWIQSATVMRILPDHIRISVVERTPIAFVREGQQIGLVDGDGVLLNMSPEGMTQHHYSFPLVTGIDLHDPIASRRTRMAVYQRLVGELDSTGQNISRQISEIDLTDPEDARVLMQDDPTLLHFGDEQFVARYQRYKAHIAEWRQQYPQLAAMDLRYDSQVVLKMASGSGTAPATVSTEDGKPVAAATPDSSTSGTKRSAATPDSSAGTKKFPATHAESHAGTKPPVVTHADSHAAVSPGAIAAKPEHPARPEHKGQPHHVAKSGAKPAPKSAAQREKEKREAARKAALLRHQHTGNTTAANRQGQ